MRVHRLRGTVRTSQTKSPAKTMAAAVVLAIRTQLMQIPFLYSAYVNSRVLYSKHFKQQQAWGAKEVRSPPHCQRFGDDVWLVRLQIVPGLFLGNLDDSLNEAALKENGITLVMSAIKSVPSWPYQSMV